MEKICDRVVWLKNGRVQTIGEARRVIDAYLQDVVDKQEDIFEKRRQEVEQEEKYAEERRENRWGKREIEIKKVKMLNREGKEKHVFAPDEGMIIELELEAYSRIKDLFLGLGFSTPREYAVTEPIPSWRILKRYLWKAGGQCAAG